MRLRPVPRRVEESCQAEPITTGLTLRTLRTATCVVVFGLRRRTQPQYESKDGVQ